ncbi:MAG: hypothetical protein ACLFTJ_08195 [Halothece sp.]
MAEIAIIRAAFREIQKLTGDELQRIYETLLKLSREEPTDTKKLQGYDNEKLRRTRSGDLRVIWQKQDNRNLVIKAGRRDNVYDDLFERRNFSNIIRLEELLTPDGVEVSEHPTYKWEQQYQNEKNWYQYIYGGYRYTPILTPYQREIFSQPWEALYNPNLDQKWLIQSSPGTGKTVCSTLYACELSQEDGTNIFLIIPEALKPEILEYPEVKRVQSRDNFWIGTLRDWLADIHPTINSENLATPQQEIEALREAAERTRTSGIPKGEEIEKTHVLLYQAFILDEDNKNRPKNAIYTSYQEARILDKLKKIPLENWQNALSNCYCRLDAAQKLQSDSPSPPKAARNILIVDEAQDYLLAELQALMSVCNEWTRQESFTYLWLLGDLNQRIQPTDFDWGQLGINKKQKLQINRNYRNSQRILEFANQFVKRAATEEAGRLKTRHPEAVANPEDAFEVGDCVSLLIYNSVAEANQFLKQLAHFSQQQETQRYLLRDLANAVKVLSPHPIQEDGLIFLNAEQAKGREFEACVAFRLFEGNGHPSVEESFNWYTLVTRARSRLLIVATQDEVERVGQEYFNPCEKIEPQQAIAWITEVASDIDLERITDDVEQRLLERCRRGKPYWDTYLALDLAGYTNEDLNQWETNAINCLRENPNQLNDELKQTSEPRLRCLLLRAMGYSWKAASEIAELQENYPNECQRLIEIIAQGLEQNSLPLEAARVRAKIEPSDQTNQAWIDNKYPFFPEVIEQSDSIINALCFSFINRINRNYYDSTN